MPMVKVLLEWRTPSLNELYLVKEYEHVRLSKVLTNGESRRSNYVRGCWRQGWLVEDEVKPEFGRFEVNAINVTKEQRN